MTKLKHNLVRNRIYILHWEKGFHVCSSNTSDCECISVIHND